MEGLHLQFLCQGPERSEHGTGLMCCAVVRVCFFSRSSLFGSDRVKGVKREKICLTVSQHLISVAMAIRASNSTDEGAVCPLKDWRTGPSIQWNAIYRQRCKRLSEWVSAFLWFYPHIKPPRLKFMLCNVIVFHYIHFNLFTFRQTTKRLSMGPVRPMSNDAFNINYLYEKCRLNVVFLF